MKNANVMCGINGTTFLCIAQQSEPFECEGILLESILVFICIPNVMHNHAVAMILCTTSGTLRTHYPRQSMHKKTQLLPFWCKYSLSCNGIAHKFIPNNNQDARLTVDARRRT